MKRRPMQGIGQHGADVGNGFVLLISGIEQGGAEGIESKVLCGVPRLLQPKSVAMEAAIVFAAMDGVKEHCGIVANVAPDHVERHDMGQVRQRLAPSQVFLKRVNVRVVKEPGHPDPLLPKPEQGPDGAGAAADVEQHSGHLAGLILSCGLGSGGQGSGVGHEYSRLAHFRLETRLCPRTLSHCFREMHKSI